MNKINLDLSSVITCLSGHQIWVQLSTNYYLLTKLIITCFWHHAQNEIAGKIQTTEGEQNRRKRLSPELAPHCCIILTILLTTLPLRSPHCTSVLKHPKEEVLKLYAWLRTKTQTPMNIIIFSLQQLFPLFPLFTWTFFFWYSLYQS